jgi:hypothetical protein
MLDPQSLTDLRDTITINLGGRPVTFALSGLSDVRASTPADGDVLTYVAADGKWEYVQPAGGGSGVVQQATKTVTFNGLNTFSTPGAGGALFTITGEIQIVALTVKCITTVTISGGAGYSDFGVFVGDEDVITNSRILVEDTQMIGGTYPVLAGSSAGPGHFYGVSFASAISLTGCPTGGGSGNDVLASGSLRIDVLWAPLSNGATLVAA